MVKRFFLALMFSVSAALAVPDTTTVQGTVYLPGGATPATSGSVTASLSSSGSVGADVVAGRVSATIAADGSVSIAIVPNDIIVPAGTYYIVNYSVKTPTAAQWSEKWTVTTAPDPIAIGSVTRVDTPPGIAAPVSTVQDEATSLTKRTALNFTGAGVTCADNSANSRTDCTIPGGGGSPGGSSQDVQVNNSSAFGSAPGFTANTSTGAVGAKILNGKVEVSKYASAGSGTSGAPWTSASGTGGLAEAAAVCPSTGCELHLSPGYYKVTAKASFGSGVYVVGDDVNTSIITADAAFSGSAILEWKNPISDNTWGGTVVQGAGGRNFTINCNGVAAHGIDVFKAYDGVTFDTVHVVDVGNASSGFKFEPNTAYTGSYVSQTVTLINTYTIHKNGGASVTGPLYSFEAVQEMSLLNTKGIGGYSANAIVNADVFLFKDCRGVSATGLSAASTDANAIHIQSTGVRNAYSIGLYFFGTTIEAATTSAKIEGTGAYYVQDAYFYGVRKQSGVVDGVNITPGPFVFQTVVRAYADIEPFTATVDSNCQDVKLRLLDAANLTSDAGTRTKVDAAYFATKSWYNGVNGYGLGLFPTDASAPAGPEVRFGHASRADYWRLFWSASSGASYGFQLRYVDTGGNSKRSITADAGTALHFYYNDVEELTVGNNDVTTLTPAVGDNDTSVATTAFARTGFLSKNTKTVTVCASGCDFVGVQEALDGTTSSASAPIVVLVMPGSYDLSGTSGIAVEPGTDSYKSITGWSRDSVILTDSNGASHNFVCQSFASNDLVGFMIENLTLEHTGASSVLECLVGFNDHRFDITMRNVRVLSSGGAAAVGGNLQGSAAGVQTALPSDFLMLNNFMEVDQGGFGLSGSVRVFSRNNMMRRLSTATSSYFGGCYSGGFQYTGSSFDSSGDTCVAFYSAVGTSSVEGPNACNALSFTNSPEQITISNFYGECYAKSGFTTSGSFGAVVSVGGGTSDHCRVNISGSTFKFTANSSGQTMFGLWLGSLGNSVTLRNVQFIKGWGDGTETSIGSTAIASAPYGEILLDRVVYDSVSVASGILVRNLEPSVVYKTLSAIGSVSLPATGAAFDANSEYRVYTVSTTLNASWRNERIPDGYETDSLFTPQFRVYWRSATATSGSATWKFGFCTGTPPVAWPCTVSTFASVQQSVAAANQIYVTAWTALPSGLVAGQPAAFTLQRDSADATLSGDAQVEAVEIAYAVK